VTKRKTGEFIDLLGDLDLVAVRGQMTWGDFVKPIKKVKTKAKPSKKRALLDLVKTLKSVTLESVLKQAAVLGCWKGEGHCDAGPDCKICRDMKEVRRLLLYVVG
jgi:mRNA-degrading endonuclease YafQ of YafQ-DinJ toxin-antitoxin module